MPKAPCPILDSMLTSSTRINVNPGNDIKSIGAGAEDEAIPDPIGDEDAGDEDKDDEGEGDDTPSEGDDEFVI